MIRIVFVAIWFCLALSVLGQNQPNPFDLQYRPKGSKTTVLPSSPKKSPNPTVIKPLDSLVDRSTVPQNEPEPGVDTASFQINKDSTDAGMGVNPFEKGVSSPDSSISKITPVDSGKIESVKINPLTHGKRVSKGVQIFFLLFSLLLLIFIVNVERNFVKDLWKVISNENYSSLHLRNQRNTMRQILFIMGYVVFLIQAGIFLYHALMVFNYQGRLFDNIWTCLVLVICIYIIRHAGIRYLRWLFNNEKEMTLFGFDISTFNIALGLVLLPINVMLNFGPESLIKPLIITGIIIIAVAYFMRQLRWMLTARQLIANSLFLFFVYLCAVEILPLWAISKFFW